MSNSNYTIKMTPKSVEDLDKIYSYISEVLFAEESAKGILDLDIERRWIYACKNFSS